MKKLIALLLAAIMLLSLAACGGSSGSSTTAETAEAAEETAAAEEASETAAEPEEEPEPVVAAIEETVLAETEAYRITAEELSFDESGLPTLSLLVENLSAEELSFDLDSFAVNQYMLTESFESSRAASVADYLPEHEAENPDLTVAAGAQSSWVLTVNAADWGLLGLTDVGEFCLNFAVTGSAGTEATGAVTLPTTIADSVDTASDTYLAAVTSGDAGAAIGGSISFSAENTYYDNGGIQVISAAVADIGSDKVLLLEAVNNSGTDAVISFGKTCVNGYQISDEVWSAPICAGRTMILSYNFNESGAASELYRNAGYYSSVLADCGVTSFSDIAVAVSAADASGNTIAEEAQVSVAISENTGAASPSGSTIYSGNGVTIQFLGRSNGPSGYVYELLFVENTNGSAVMVDGGAAYEIDGIAVGCLDLAASQSGIVGFVFPSNGISASSFNSMNYTVYLTGAVNTQVSVSS